MTPEENRFYPISVLKARNFPSIAPPRPRAAFGERHSSTLRSSRRIGVLTHISSRAIQHFPTLRPHLRRVHAHASPRYRRGIVILDLPRAFERQMASDNRQLPAPPPPSPP